MAPVVSHIMQRYRMSRTLPIAGSPGQPYVNIGGTLRQNTMQRTETDTYLDSKYSQVFSCATTTMQCHTIKPDKIIPPDRLGLRGG